jgi:hypothetical protein
LNENKQQLEAGKLLSFFIYSNTKTDKVLKRSRVMVSLKMEQHSLLKMAFCLQHSHSPNIRPA